MDGQMVGGYIPFPEDRINGKERQRRQKSLTWWPECWPGAAKLNLRPGFAT